MKFSASFIAAAAAFLSTGVIAKDGRTFAVLYFGGDDELVRCRTDPVVNPGGVAAHLHSVMGGNAFSASMPGEAAKKSTCTNAKVKNDHSNYWVPSLYFNANNGTLIPVRFHYMKAYYFFEGTNDVIKAFPPGLRMLSGDPSLRTPLPIDKVGANTDPADGPIISATWTCPRMNDNEPMYGNSDGTKGLGVQDPGDKNSGFGFSDKRCDVGGAPLRADIHFPSCYNPAAGPENYKTNMAWPTRTGTNKRDCPKGWIHTPHLFYEVYWRTAEFDDLWTPGQGKHPWVLSNGDTTGYSLHGDFLNGWDTETLQHVIDTCDTGNGGMNECPGLKGGETPKEEYNNCKVQCALGNEVAAAIPYTPAKTLLGNNPLSGYQKGAYVAPGGAASSVAPASPSGTAAKPPVYQTTMQTTKKPTTTVKAKPTTTKKAATTVKAKPTTTKKATTKSRKHHHTKQKTTTKTVYAVKPAKATPTPKSYMRHRKHSKGGAHRHHAGGQYS